MYIMPKDIEVSANVFGRQGYPFPIVRSGSAATLGSDSALTVLVSPEIDTFRFPNLWNTDLRVARSFRANRANIRLVGDLFNVFNANTAIVRVNNIGITTGANPFNTLAQNLSPRIFRVGVIVGF
jgi:hypothetical protein